LPNQLARKTRKKVYLAFKIKWGLNPHLR